MPVPHATRSVLLPVLALAAAAGGCSATVRESGRAPEGPVRAVESAASRREQLRRDDARRDAADAAEARAAAPAGGAADESAARYGVAESLRFHRDGCEELAAAPSASRITFVSVWDALDARFSPCTRCRPTEAR